MLFTWLISTLTLILVSLLVPGVHFANFYSALIAAAILGLLNALIRPILIILTLPINILTLGLFTLIINGGLIWLAATIVKGFTVDNFWTAVVAGIIIWLINTLANLISDALSHPAH